MVREPVKLRRPTKHRERKSTTPAPHGTHARQSDPMVLPIRATPAPQTPPRDYRAVPARSPLAGSVPQYYPAPPNPGHPEASHWTSTPNLAMAYPQMPPQGSQGHRPPDRRRTNWTERLHLPRSMSRPFHAASASVNDLGNTVRDINDEVNGHVGLAAGAYEQCAGYLDDIITQIDGEIFRHGVEGPRSSRRAQESDSRGREPARYMPAPPHPYAPPPPERHLNHARSFAEPSRPVASSTYFSKIWLYSNSRLPPHLPPLKLYLPTYPILTLAAHHSLMAYAAAPPPSSESSHPASTTLAIPSTTPHLKSFILRSVPVSTSPQNHTVIVSIRGSASFGDWSVNLKTSPQPPVTLLDDPGNLTHGGFLNVAVTMLPCIARHLTTVLDGILAAELARAPEPHRPHRAPKVTLLLTGHSAGGAIAALLYAHMGTVSPTCASPLRALRARFRRIHCVTFGAPPITLLPLRVPSPDTATPNRRHAKSTTTNPDWRSSLFFSFINEGDPVARADPAVVRSLLRLCASAAPAPRPASRPAPRWAVPPGTLSCAGRLVLLRGFRAEPAGTEGRKKSRKGMGLLGEAKAGWGRSAVDVVGCVGRGGVPGLGGWGVGSGGSGKEEGVGEVPAAYVIDDTMLRGVVFGDPMAHQMRVYVRRVEGLAVRAVMGE